jgi:uncharacterized phiE125 gp8 family phage protein
MPLILTSPPATEPVSLAEAKAHLRVPHADDDATISTLIIAARRAAEARTGLALINQGWSLWLDGWPCTTTVSLGLAPVSAIADIVAFSEDGTPATYDPAHYYLDGVSRPGRAVLRPDRLPPLAGRRVNGIEIRFTAGFGAAASAVPQDLKQALLLVIAHWFEHRGEADGGSLPMAAIEILARHRPVRLT